MRVGWAFRHNPQILFLFLFLGSVGCNASDIRAFREGWREAEAVEQLYEDGRGGRGKKNQGLSSLFPERIYSLIGSVMTRNCSGNCITVPKVSGAHVSMSASDLSRSGTGACAL